MEWLGWLIAALAALAAAYAWRQLVAERSRANELMCERMEAENRLDALQSDLAARAGHVDPAEVRAELVAQLAGPLAAARGQLDEAGEAFADYREQVRRFDAAVQYCLQPVELIFGADKAGLDQLVSHVEGARRGLFEARAALLAHRLHSGAPELGGAVLGELQRIAEPPAAE
jgi:hypothetical protein